MKTLILAAVALAALPLAACGGGGDATGNAALATDQNSAEALDAGTDNFIVPEENGLVPAENALTPVDNGGAATEGNTLATNAL